MQQHAHQGPVGSRRPPRARQDSVQGERSRIPETFRVDAAVGQTAITSRDSHPREGNAVPIERGIYSGGTQRRMQRHQYGSTSSSLYGQRRPLDALKRQP
jgi:hypothetical protein